MSLAITYRRAGDPSEVLEVTDIGEPHPPGPGQLQVQVSAFPIHPGDLLAVSAPQTPGRELIAGIEATGVVTEVGAGVTGFSPGTRVTFFPHQGAWRQVVNVDAAIAVPVPDSVPDEVAAQMLCNPITALMLRRAAQQHFGVGFDGVVLNNAAASSVGRLFTAIAEHHQIATVSIVRSEQRAQQLRDRFPTVPVVSTSDPGWVEQVHTAAAGRPIPVALDPVGGDAAGDLLSVLSPGGTLIIYGALAQEPIPLHAATVLHSRTCHTRADDQSVAQLRYHPNNAPPTLPAPSRSQQASRTTLTSRPFTRSTESPTRCATWPSPARSAPWWSNRDDAATRAAPCVFIQMDSAARALASTSLDQRSATMFNNVGFIGSGPLTQALAPHLVAAQIPVRISNSRGPHCLTELVAELGDAAASRNRGAGGRGRPRDFGAAVPAGT